MRQFDVCRLNEKGHQLVLVLQHDTTDELDTRIVAPLFDRPYRRLIDRVRLPIDLGGNHCVVQLDRMAAIERRTIGTIVGNLAADERRIKNALDLLFLGV